MAHDPLTSEQKADFTDIYTEPDPRAYFRTLMPLDYRIPQAARPVFDAVLTALPPRATALDVCCSYGINAALLRYDLDLADLNTHYGAPELDGAGPEELRAADREFFAAQERRHDLDVLGLDISQPAIDYARDVGLLSDGWAENLESDEPTSGLAEHAADVDLIISTGGIGYVGAPTFTRLLEHVADSAKLWVAVFVLRVFDYAPIAEVLAGHGLVTEPIPQATCRQRRFADADEQAAAVQDVRDRGLDPAGLEADGWFYADCFLSRPAAVAAAQPAAGLFAGLRSPTAATDHRH